MSNVFPRPTLPHGTLPVTDWDYDVVGQYANWDEWTTEEVVDAKVLQNNWSILFSHINGNLNGTDLNVDGAAISETTAIQKWSATTYDPDEAWPSRDYRHSHDGIDSSYLFARVITSDVLGDGHLMLRSPSITHSELAMHMRSYSTRGADYIPTVDLAFPYDNREWGTSLFREKYTTDTNGALHLIVTAFVPDWSNLSLAKKRSLNVPCISDITDASEVISSVSLEQPRMTLDGFDDDIQVPDVVFQTLGLYMQRAVT